MKFGRAKAVITVYQSGNGQWYWRCTARNGEIVLDGAEGYDSKGNALRAARRVQKILAEAVVVNERKPS